MPHTFDKPITFELVELEEYSGPAIKIYSVILDRSEETLFDKFLEENEKIFPKELEELLDGLEIIGKESGLVKPWYKDHQGAYGDGVCYLFDHPDKKLRLYFIRFEDVFRNVAIVIGGGGHKPREIRAFQEDEKLRKENYLLRDIAKVLHKAIKKGDLIVDEYGFDYDGPLIFKL